MLIKFAKCCHPIAGDAVTGIFSPGTGIVVHRQECPNLGEFRQYGENWIDVEWEDELDTEFLTDLRVDVGNHRGVLATVASAIAEKGSNIDNVSIEERDGISTRIDFIISTKDRKHLAAIMRRIKALPSVLRVSRSMG